MKSIALLAATTMVFFSVALAQSEKSAAAPEAKPLAQEAAKPAVKEAPKRAMTATRRARRAEDARHCLERPSNTEIIKCSEAYL